MSTTYSGPDPLAWELERARSAVAKATTHLKQAKRQAQEPELGAISYALCDLTTTGRALDNLLKIAGRG